MTSLTDIRSKLKAISPRTEILAVSKLQSTDKIRALYHQGQRKFAENYVQEATEKLENLKDLDIEWHFIGRLQKNKIKFVIGKFALIHSVDSLELAQAIDRKCQEAGILQKILLQLNLAEEETKGGFSLTEFEKAALELSSLKSVQIAGLMTMPPLFDDPEEARPFFKKLFNIRNQFNAQFPDLKELSMGTSSDFLVAAQEGATLVRLGTVLFGERPTKN